MKIETGCYAVKNPQAATGNPSCAGQQPVAAARVLMSRYPAAVTK